MKLQHIILSVSAVLTLIACEDYTDHNFGTRDELYQPTETGTFNVNLGRSDYATIAANTENIEKSIEMGRDTLDPDKVDSTYFYALQQVAETKCFNNYTKAEDYIPSILDSKVPFATDGATVIVTVKEDAVPFVHYPCYERISTLGLSMLGKYLFVPEGIDSCLYSTGIDTEGLISGLPVRRYDADHIFIDGSLDPALIEGRRLGNTGTYMFTNVDDAYICAAGSGNNFLTCEDTEDLDDSDQAVWTAELQADGSMKVTNKTTDKIIYWQNSTASAGLFAGTETGITPIQAFKLVKSATATESNPQKASYTFVKSDGKWVIKDSYLDQTLLGSGSTNADEVKKLCGWSLVCVEMPSTLSYIWKLDASYGLRCSAYANSTYNVTEAWAISPEMDFSAATAPYIKFDQAQKYAGDVTKELTVWATADKVSDEDIDPESCNWKQLEIETYPDGSNWDYITTQLSLKDFIGQPSVRIGFKYVSTSSAAATWEVKNVVVKNEK